MNYLIVIISLFMTHLAFGQSYQAEIQKQQMYPYKIKKGDTLSEILNANGYYDVFKNMDNNKFNNPIHLTIWKNGLSLKDLKNLKVGSTIYLPINYKSKAKRSIASVPSLLSDIPEKEIKKIVIKYAEEN